MWAKTRNLYFWKGITENFKKVLSKWDALGNKGAISFGTPFGGINANNEQLVVNSNGQVGIDYANMLSGLPQTSTLLIQDNIIISSNSTLNGNVSCANFTVESGVTLTTNGYSILCTGTFTNNGTINCGTNNSGGSGFFKGGNGSYGIFIQADTLIAGTINATGENGTVTDSSGDGGSGSGGGGVILLAYGSGGYTAGTYNVNGGTYNASGVTGTFTYNGGNGGLTLVTGGTGGDSTTQNGQNGSTPSAPTLSNSLISSWYSDGMVNYLSGAGGGGGGSVTGSGGNGTSFSNSYGGSGGGGGAGTSSSETAGGNGGNGQVLTYSYGTTPPVTVSVPSSGGTQIAASTNSVALAQISYISNFGKPIEVKFQVYIPTTGLTFYIEDQNGNTIGYIGDNQYYSFNIDGLEPISKLGDTYTFTLYANNPTTTAQTAYLYVGQAKEIYIT